MGKDTKDRILDEALVSFVENGYKGTNLRDFAAGMGLSKSALYSHYDSKEAIWNALLDKMEAYYARRFGSVDNMPEIPMSCEELFATTMKMVNFTVSDERIVLTRKLLLAEQFHDERVKKLATEHFLNGTREIYKIIFGKMMENDLLKQEDPDMLAFAFTSPITALIHYCDREPEKEPEIMQQVEAFVKYFIKTYGIQGKRHP
ncbi:MAG: TetR/AcrR family transcriptional regulator [Bacillota bacterium]|nr:TetR/AcrR family transcriptional regulator [Bacillota bacterium]